MQCSSPESTMKCSSLSRQWPCERRKKSYESLCFQQTVKHIHDTCQKFTSACFPQRREGDFFYLFIFFSGMIRISWDPIRNKAHITKSKAKTWSSGQNFQFWREAAVPRQTISDGKVLSSMNNLMKPNRRGNTLFVIAQANKELSASNRKSSGMHWS